jgi:phosphatidylglycerol:prolipoprotein diacylglycerol transferase
MDFRVAFSIFGFDVYWYGIVIAVAMASAVALSARRFAERGGDREVIYDGALVVLALAIVGARLYHVFSEYNDGTPGWSYYRVHPLEILNLRSGGLGIFGGVLGGIAGAFVLSAWKRVPMWQLADAIGPALLLGQAIGRWGNYFNQELYGGPTGSSWFGIRIDASARVAPYGDMAQFPPEARFHPTFLYECIWNLVGLALLTWIERRFGSERPGGWLRRGDMMAGYLLWYGFGRMLLESTLRVDAFTYTTGGLPTGVLFAAGWIIGGVALLALARVRRSAGAAPQL